MENRSNRPMTMNAGHLASGRRITVPVRLPADGPLTVKTGRGRERLTVRREEDHLVWQFFDIEGEPVKPADHWWERNTYFPNGFFKDNFALSQDFRDRVNALRSGFHRDMDTAFFPVTLEIRQGKIRFFFDHILIAEMPETADLRSKEASFILPPGGAAGEVITEKIRDLPKNFYPVNLTSRCNIPGFSGKLPAAAEGVLTVDGVPFELSPANWKGFTGVDVGKSWFQEGTLRTYEPPNSGTFGGRWSGALGGSVSRLQFRVPYRRYTAVYLLATCEKRPDRIPAVTAQFFRTAAGFPKNFSVKGGPRILEMTADRDGIDKSGGCGSRMDGEKGGIGKFEAAARAATAEKLPVAHFRQTPGGGPQILEMTADKLQVIRIPVEPGELVEFSDRNTVEVELTGDVRIYRAWPDPSHFSIHGAGMPSGVKVFAMTLESSPVSIDFQPESQGNVWVEDAPSYKLTVSDHTGKAGKLTARLVTRSFDGRESLDLRQDIEVPPHGKAVTRFDLPLKKYGWHSVTLTCGGESYRHTLARLRRRETRSRPFDSKGFMFGYWEWDGAHLTPHTTAMLRLWSMAGLESFARGNGSILDRTVFTVAQRLGFKYFWRHYRGVERPPESPETIADYLKEREVHKGTHPLSHQSSSRFFEPVYTHIFAEPGGIGTHGVLPEFYGEPMKKRTDEEEKNFLQFKKKIIDAHKIIRRDYPGTKILLPWGDPVFCVPYLQDEETRELFDGIAYDTGYFLRLPEQQLHQCSIHRMMQFMHYWKKYRSGPPFMISCEGPCIARVAPGSLDQAQHAAHTIRCALLLGAYGINRQFSIAGTADCASYWGEQHYGGGAFSRINDLNPYPVYPAIAALTRHLRHMEFTRWIPTGSLSVYCLEFKDPRNGKLLHIFWTIRGKRPIRMKFDRAFDLMDNEVKDPVISEMPVFVYGCDGKFSLGEPDHSDAVLGPHSLLLGSCRELFTAQSQDADDEYVNSFPEAVRRFPAVMELKKVPGGLSVHLPEQEKERLTMPYFTTLKPVAPIPIPGKAKYITVEVTADSDWGRVVYVVRDAKGEKFFSVGQKNAWNGDDQRNDSFFNFDGKRLVRFELPSSAEYDRFREMGSTWWGSADGRGTVELPLKLEKIFIERRRHAMYVNSLEETSRRPVILGNIYAEYESEEMMKPPPRLTMPAADERGKTFNPIEELDRRGTLPATEITAVEHPDHYYDGTRGVFHFRTVPEAAGYDIYLSLSSDGSQAIRMGEKLKRSGVLINGFLADTDFYAFIVYTAADGRQSKVSKPFRFKLHDSFGNK